MNHTTGAPATATTGNPDRRHRRAGRYLPATPAAGNRTADAARRAA